MEQDAFFKYLDNGFDSIEGWSGNRNSVAFMAIFRELFNRSSEVGGACEIGVHHAKYLIAIHNLLGGEHRSLGMDLFKEQEKNIDGSGGGDEYICTKNINIYARNPELITLASVDSISLTLAETLSIKKEFGSFRFFSIDGGHTPVHLVHDFMIASECTSPIGLIAIDDLFNPDWPGVTEGIYKLVSAGTSSFVPLFLTRKKLFLCHLSVRYEYMRFLGNYCGNVAHKVVSFFGNDVLSLNFGAEY